MSVLSLIHSAFGHKCLYTVLNAPKTSSQDELKRSYRRAALRYHPDRAHVKRDDAVASCTLKFQAVSAAYQVLMDVKMRSVYDATGRVLDDNDDDAPLDGTPQQRRKQSSAANGSQQKWESFFQSIFNEMISTGRNHAQDAIAYRESDQERTDVIKYYSMCKGNLDKVVDCIVHGSSDDKERWMKDIIDPAVDRGEIDCYSSSKIIDAATIKKKRMVLNDSSSEDEEVGAKITCKKRLKRNGHSTITKTSNQSAGSSSLLDTDDEYDADDNQTPLKQPSSQTHQPQAMSKRDRMNYRVAKKQKAKAEKEIEISKIINSKSWGGDADERNASGSTAYGFSRHPKPRKAGGFSEDLLTSLEQKYGIQKKKAKKRSK